MMNDLDLIDIWRNNINMIEHFHGEDHLKKQSRLDYFLTTTDIESFVVSP